MGRPLDALLALKEDRRLYLVGGTVRDIVMERAPADFDFAVSGSGIEFARKLARKIRGKFVLLSEPDDQARVVYRKELTLDFNGFGDRTIHDDLQRRDFTANAIAVEIRAEDDSGRIPARRKLTGGKRLGLSEELMDPFEGRGRSRSAGLYRPPRIHCRWIPCGCRAYRFALELGFEIDDEVMRQARYITLEPVAPERIGCELMRIMDCDGSYRVHRAATQLGLLGEMFPEAVKLMDLKPLMKHSLGTYP